jgi:Coenzyme PQQ synthesis protein D (PqqD)
MGSGKLRPSRDVISRRVGDEIVLVDLQSDEMYSLNSTGARAWELLSEGHDAEAIDETLSDEYGIDREEVQRELERLLDELQRRRLVEPA